MDGSTTFTIPNTFGNALRLCLASNLKLLPRAFFGLISFYTPRAIIHVSYFLIHNVMYTYKYESVDIGKGAALISV